MYILLEFPAYIQWLAKLLRIPTCIMRITQYKLEWDTIVVIFIGKFENQLKNV